MQQGSLLKTKLYMPRVRPELVSRPRLIERLNAGLHRKLTLISAPAGFGKTMLLSEWAAGIDEPGTHVAWLSLDEKDSDLARFMTYLIAALQTTQPGLGESLLAGLQSPGPVNAEAVLINLINEIADLEDELLLVLDDYHAIESPAVDEALSFLLEHLPPPPAGMHLVIAGRMDPSLPLSRLRARGQMTEIRESDLRFTLDEVAAFLNEATGLDLSADHIAALGARTEGWIAGLQLAALSLQGLESGGEITGFVKGFAGTDRYVQDYLADEVLRSLPTATQQFLLQTSILDRLSGPLCDAVRFGSSDPPNGPEEAGVAGRRDSQSMLETLDAANLFIVPLDNERVWYRYHHLFADLLRQRLQHDPPTLSSPRPGRAVAADVDELHIRASVWYEENGLEVDALYHAAAAGDFERAARLVEGNGKPLYHRGAVTPVLNWLESLPSKQLDARPSLWVMYAEVLMTRGQLAGAEKRYLAAEAALKDVERDAPTRDLLGRIANGRASLACFECRPERVIDQAQRALGLLRPDNLAIRGAASLSLGYAYQLQGDRTAAAQALSEAIASGRASGNVFVTMLATQRLGDVEASELRLPQGAATYRRALDLAGEHPPPYTGDAHLGLARILYEWNDLDAAQHHADRSLPLLQQVQPADKSIACEVFLSRLSLARGDAAGAAAALAECIHQARQRELDSTIPEIAATRVLVLLRQGDLETADRLADAYQLPVSQARVHLAGGNASAALAVLEPFHWKVEARGWRDEILKVMVLTAVALDAHGDKDEALQALAEALRLADPGAHIRTFVDEGPPMAELLARAAARGIKPDYSTRLLAAFDDPADDRMERPLSSSSLIEPLTRRETEILELIAEGLSNREIGERLFLALSSVKGHNRNIFGKLQVQRRTEAVARARELGLL